MFLTSLSKTFRIESDVVSAVLVYTWIQICPFSHSPSLDFLPLSLQPHPILSSLLPPLLYVTSWQFSALFPVLSTPTRPPGSCCLVALKIRIARLAYKKVAYITCCCFHCPPKCTAGLIWLSVFPSLNVSAVCFIKSYEKHMCLCHFHRRGATCGGSF